MFQEPERHWMGL